MDNPGISLFQGTDIQINNSKNVEEEEDLEDQLRRKEELQNLLQANLDDFNYDDSTINSSTNASLVSVDNLEQQYKNAISPNEQLKVLYDVRCREIQALKNDYDKFKKEKNKEIDTQKQRNLLLEAELRQLGISLKNSENLLVDKTETINVLNKKLEDKEAEAKKLEKLVEEHESDLATYKSELAESHLKLQSQNGPFNLNAKYNSEELKQSLQIKIEKLENTLAQEARKFEICNTEKEVLQAELANLASEKTGLEEDNEIILRNLDSAQQQCKDLLDVIEVLRHENDHFKARVNEVEGKSEMFLSNPTAGHANQYEKLKKMLVDKSVELDSLKVKLRNYENDLKDLIEYRQLKGDIYKKEFTKCNNESHTKELLLMQNELQNYRRIIDDKNQQILSLNANNKDLKEKIEEMLLQTRNEIQNISSKYNMPQLENMRKELDKSEYTVQILSNKLEESEERRLSLLQKLKGENTRRDIEALMEELEKCREDLRVSEELLANERQQHFQLSKEMEHQKSELLKLRSELDEIRIQRRKSKNHKVSPTKGDITENTNMKNEYESLKRQLKSVMEHLERNSNGKTMSKEQPEIVAEIKMQMDNFLEQIEKDTIEKGLIQEQISSWKKLLNQIELTDPDEILKGQYKEAVMNLHDSKEKILELENALRDLKESITLVENEKSSLKVELKGYTKNLQDSENLREKLSKELNYLKKVVKKMDTDQPKPEVGIEDTEHKIANLQNEVEKLNEQLNLKENDLAASLQAIKKYEQQKEEMRKWFEKIKNEIDRLKEENKILETQLQEAKLKENKESNQNLEKENEYKARLEDELMKHELKLRDELQIEYQKRICDIEKGYQKTFKETTELCKHQKVALEEQDKKFRETLKVILTECDTCTTKLEHEKMEFAGKFQLLKNEFDQYKIAVADKEQNYFKMLKKMEREAQKNNEAWKQWSKKVVCSCLDIEATNKKVRDRVIASMEKYDQEVAAIKMQADAKMGQKSSEKDRKMKLNFKYS